MSTSKVIPRGLSPCHASGRSVGNIGFFDLLLPPQNWGMHSTETPDISRMDVLAELRNHWVLSVAIQAFSAWTFLLQTCATWAMLMSQQELSMKLQRAQKLRVYCLVQIFLRNSWQCYFWLRICCTKRSNLSDKCKKTVHKYHSIESFTVGGMSLKSRISSLFELFVLFKLLRKISCWLVEFCVAVWIRVDVCSSLFRMQKTLKSSMAMQLSGLKL